MVGNGSGSCGITLQGSSYLVVTDFVLNFLLPMWSFAISREEVLKWWVVLQGRKEANMLFNKKLCPMWVF